MEEIQLNLPNELPVGTQSAVLLTELSQRDSQSPVDRVDGCVVRVRIPG